MQTKYRYPFPGNLEVRIAKPGGRYAHENFPESRHAIDFPLPLGTQILAASEGIVRAAKSDSDKYINLADMEQMDIEKLIEFSLQNNNFVWIDHLDGTNAEYVHLGKDGIFVREGQKVSAGQLIGYSGLSGCMSEPHLHFNVFMIENGGW